MPDIVHAAVLSGSTLILAATAAVTDAAHSISRTEQIAVLVIGGLILTGLYLVACTIWPFANCPACSGSGKSRSPSGKKFRTCRRCNGTGRRERTGTKFLNRHKNR